MLPFVLDLAGPAMLLVSLLALSPRWTRHRPHAL
jgi:hypothetical protein